MTSSVKGPRAAAALLAVCASTGGGCTTTPTEAPAHSRVAERASGTDAAERRTVVAASLLTDEITEVRLTREPWRFAGYEGQIITTPHYRVYTTLDRCRWLDRLGLFMERGLEHYSTAIVRLPKPRKHLKTYLFSTRNQWEAKTRQLLLSRAPDFLTLGRGGYTTRATSVLYYIGRSDTLSIAAHEGWHQYTQRTFKYPLPVWLEEGLATYMEGYVSDPYGLPKFRSWANLERYHTLRDAVGHGRLIPLGELFLRRPESFLSSGKNRLLIYYGQVWALTHFLMEGEQGRYRGDLQQLLLEAAGVRTAASGHLRDRRHRARSRLGPAVVQAYFNHDLGAFETQYLHFVRQISRAGGRGRIVEGRRPF
ncbi:MAG: hypothetical protein IH888_11010 [Planctomycetes bacterium]|nr:hypothetical protein [Planctomycetota bacterium]